MGNRLGIKVDHNCSLPAEEDVVVAFIASGRFVYLRRFLRNITIIDETNPMSLTHFKSLTGITYEKIRQLHYYYYTIHPFSKFRTVWEFCIMTLFIFSMVCLPVQATYIRSDDQTDYLRLITDIIFIFDIILTFFTGYVDRNNRAVIFEKTLIAINYIGGYFLFDLLSSLNTHFFQWSSIELPPKVRNILVFCNFCKIVRIWSLSRYVENFKNYYKINPYTFKVAKVTYLGIVSIMWAAFLLFFLSFLHEESFLITKSELRVGVEAFIICAHRVVMLLFLIGNMQTVIISHEVLLYEIFLMMCGACINLYIFALILKIVNKYNTCANNYYQFMMSIQEYASCMNLPHHVRQRIVDYFDFKFEKVFFDDEEIYSTISKQLHHALVMHICRNLLESVEIFRDLPPALLVNIVLSMKSEVYLSTDVIVQAGTPGNCMFFIKTGTVAVYTGVGKEVCHLSEGSHFGEIALMMEEKRVASVIAVDNCELYSLSRKDFYQAIEPYPDLYVRIKTLALFRLEKTIKEIDEDTPSQASSYRGFMFEDVTARDFYKNEDLRSNYSGSSSSFSLNKLTTAEKTKSYIITEVDEEDPFFINYSKASRIAKQAQSDISKNKNQSTRKRKRGKTATSSNDLNSFAPKFEDITEEEEPSNSSDSKNMPPSDKDQSSTNI